MFKDQSQALSIVSLDWIANDWWTLEMPLGLFAVRCFGYWELKKFKRRQPMGWTVR